jgi:hypothetical protein
VTHILDPRAAIVTELTATGPHIRRINELGDDSNRAAVDGYIAAILDAQIRLWREVEGVKHG